MVRKPPQETVGEWGHWITGVANPKRRRRPVFVQEGRPAFCVGYPPVSDLPRKMKKLLTNGKNIRFEWSKK